MQHAGSQGEALLPSAGKLSRKLICPGFQAQILKGSGAWRVHGGGFAGTIQAFVPEDKLGEFRSAMQAVFGEDACYVLKIRNYGGIQLY